jgi:hypothetical protein
MAFYQTKAPPTTLVPPKILVPTEHTLIVNSAQRDHPTTTDSNDIVVRLHPGCNWSAVKVECASAEIPNSQYTVPENSSFLRISEGLFTHGGDEALQHMTINTINGDYTVWLPFYTNVVEFAERIDAVTVEWTTANDHGLANNGLWDWGESIRIIGSPVLHTAQDQLMAANADFTITGNDTFQLTNLNPAWVALIPAVPTAGAWGHVWAPPIPSPTMLAERLTRGFAAAGESRITVEYKEEFGTYEIKAPAHLQAKITAPLITSGASTTTNFRPTYGCLDTATGEVDFEEDPVQQVPSMSTYFQCGSSKRSSLTGARAHHQAYVARLKPAFHTADTMESEVNFQFQRYWFDPQPCAGTAPCPAAVQSQFCFVDADGNAHNIPITAGKYSPTTLAAHIEALMDATAAHYDYTVTFNAATHTFTISEDNGHIFSLEFQCGDPYDPTGVLTIAARLGFENIAYRGCSSYTSARPHHNVSAQLRYGDSEFYLSQWIYTMVNRSDERQFHISASKRLPMEVTLNYVAGAGVGGTGGILQVLNTTFAHGHRVRDIVHITEQVDPQVPATWRQHLFRVSTVTDAFNYECDDIGAFLLAGPAAAGIDRGPFRYAQFNLHNIRPEETYPIVPPKTLGTRKFEYMASGDSCHQWIDSDGIYDFDPPHYVLIQLIDNAHLSSRQYTQATGFPGGNTGYGNDGKTLAKVQLGPDFRLERLWPVDMTSASGKRLTQFRLVLRNPDLTKYETNYREWSCTLVVTTLDPPMIGSGGV